MMKKFTCTPKRPEQILKITKIFENHRKRTLDIHNNTRTNLKTAHDDIKESVFVFHSELVELVKEEIHSIQEIYNKRLPLPSVEDADVTFSSDVEFDYFNNDEYVKEDNTTETPI